VHRDRFGIEPACAVLEFPVSSYCHAKKREAEPTARGLRDAVLKERVMEVWKDRRKGREVYGARKVWLTLNEQGIPVARCTVERLMGELGIGGVRSGRKRPRTMVPGDPAAGPSDLLGRCFDAPAPNRRWVADITYVMTFSGWVYTAFVMDLHSRRIVGWQVADHLRSDLALDALEMAIWAAMRISKGWCIILTAASSILLFATLNGWGRRAQSVRWAVKVIHMIMRLRSR
jgi:putative transposase